MLFCVFAFRLDYYYLYSLRKYLVLLTGGGDRRPEIRSVVRRLLAGRKHHFVLKHLITSRDEITGFIFVVHTTY